MKELYPEIRRQEMFKLINQDGQVTVLELSRRFNVSEVTIRNDLQALAEQGLIIRTHGGAISARWGAELSLKIRRQQMVNEKDRIGIQSAGLIADGEAVFLDTSSTALAIVPHLKHRRDLTIITNSLAVAQAAGELAGVNVVMSGGTYKRDTVSLVGSEGLEMLHNFNIQKGFFGAHGLNDPEGLTDVSVAEADVKRTLIKMCREVIAILDATKWGRVGLASFARLEDIHIVVTDHHPGGILSEKLATLGIQIIIA